MSTTTKIFIFVLALLSCIALFWYFDIAQYLNLTFIQSNFARFQAFYVTHFWLTIAVYFVIYLIVAALSLPGAAVLTLLAGALFGLGLGTLLVSFASTLGATIAFLVARFIIREPVQNRFGEYLAKINAGIDRDGAFYLFTLRLIPAFPFFVINLLMGLTNIKTWTFYWVSQIGMLAGTIVYVNAGRALSTIDSLSEVLSPTVLISFVLLGLFPWIARFILHRLSPKAQ